MIPSHGVERIGAVIDMNFMATTAECLAEPVDVCGISSETMSPEEGGDHAEFHCVPTSMSQR
jgi:hypothetical protein